MVPHEPIRYVITYFCEYIRRPHFCQDPSIKTGVRETIRPRRAQARKNREGFLPENREGFTPSPLVNVEQGEELMCRAENVTPAKKLYGNVG